MKKGRRILALLLAFVMMASQIPTAAATENQLDIGIETENLTTTGESNTTGETSTEGENGETGDDETGTGPSENGETGTGPSGDGETDGEILDDDDLLDDEEGDDEDNLLIMPLNMMRAFSGDEYTYTIDVFSEGAATPAMPALIILDSLGDEITPIITDEVISRFRRISFESDSDKVTVVIQAYGNENLGAFSSNNDKRIALTAEHNHAYVQRYMPVTFYISADPVSRQVTATAIKYSPNGFNFWGWANDADFPSYSAFGGTTDDVTDDLIPHGISTTNAQQTTYPLATLANEATIYFKVRMEPDNNWGTNQWRTLFGTGDNDQNISGDKFAQFTMPPIPDPDPEVPAGFYRYNINYFRFNRDSAGWNLWYWGVDGQAANSPNFPAAAASGWSSISFDTEEAELNFNLKKGNNWEERDNLISRTIVTDPVTRTATVWLIEDRDQIIYGVDPELMNGGLFKQHIRRAWSDTTNTVTARISNIPPAGSSIDVTSTQALIDNFRLYDATFEINVPLLSASFTADRITLTANTNLNPQHHYIVHYNTTGTAPDNETVFAEKVMMRRMLDDFAYTGELGMKYTPQRTDFRLWAPTANEVALYIYNDLTINDFKELNLIGGLGTNVTKIKEEKYENPDAKFLMSRNDTNGLWSYGTNVDILNGTYNDNVFTPGTSSGYKYYIYRITYPDGTADYAPDPYAIGASPNGWLSAILDLDSPAALPNDGSGKPTNLHTAHHESATDAVLYELHIRDFSMHPTSGISKNHKGKYLAFTEKGTSVQQTSGVGALMTGVYDINGNAVPIPDGPSTGIDHLIELGVTHVHLLPTFDYGSVDELRPNNFADNRAFNWGYDPQNYNVPEGNYATDVFDPYARVREFRQMVNALHEAGLKVVMDVVYNHTYSTNDGPFQRAVPGYYYRTGLETGLYTDGAGCGNEVADERAMVQKFIVDSVLHWQKEYGIDGFRFDLMGLHVQSTMIAVTNALRANDPQVVVYGEPWPGYAWEADHVIPAASKPEIYRGAQKDNGWAFFNDHFRGPLKGSPDHNDRDGSGNPTDANKGFITGITANAGLILHGARGWQHPNNGASNIIANASETVNYITAHDNLNLWDKISISFWTNGHPDLMIWDEHKPSPIPTNPPRRPAPGFTSVNAITDRDTGTGRNDAGVTISTKAQLLSAGIILTSQGVPFFQAGDEFLRSKQGHKNSYNASDLINVINWQDKADYGLVFDYYQGLIELRKSHPAFRMDDLDDINTYWQEIGFTTPADAEAKKANFVNSGSSNLAVPGVVAFKIDGGAIGDTWENIYVVYNGNEDHDANVNLGHTDTLTRVVNHEAVNLDIGLGTVAAGAWPTVPARSIAVFTDAELLPFTSDYNIIFELASGLTYHDSDIHVWQAGGSDLLNSPFKFDWTGDEGLAIAPIMPGQLGREFGFIVRPTGAWVPDRVNNSFNGFGPDIANIDRFITTHAQEPNTKIRLTPNQRGFRTYAEAVTHIGVNADFGQEIFFRWRDQERFVAGIPQNTSPVTLPRARFRVNGGVYDGTWSPVFALNYNSTEDMYSINIGGTGLNLSPGDIVRYQFSFDGGSTWVEDEYNLVNGESQLLVPEIKLGFAHDEFSLRQLNVLVVSGLENVHAVHADLRAFGLSETEDIPMLTPGRFSKVVEPAASLGTKNVPVTVVFDDGSSASKTVSTEVVANTADDFDWDEAIIYFMVTDRFAKLDGNGNVVTPNPNLINTRPEDPPLSSGASGDGVQLGAYAGGDFKGLTKSLDYLKELGVNTIWITPIVENIPHNIRDGNPDIESSYHGYWAKNFENLDARLGSDTDFAELIAGIHNRGMKLMLDIVLNHAGYDMALMNGEATEPHFFLPDGTSMFRPIVELDNGTNDPLTGSLNGLPDFRTEDLFVRDLLVKWQLKWAEEYGIDYFRVDTVKHVENDAWKALKSGLIENNADFKMIGELWVNNPYASNLGGYLDTQSMDSLLDFDFKFIASGFVQDLNLEIVANRLKDRETMMKANPLLSYGQFLSSHDEDNFGTMVPGIMSDKIAQMQAAASLQLTALGQPVIYYGEDVGQYAYNSSGPYGGTTSWYHPNRYSFDWDNTFNPASPVNEPGNAINQHYRAITKTRAMFSKTYSKGNREYYATGNGNVLAFSTTYGTETVLTFINRSSTAQNATLTVTPFTEGTKLLDYYAMIKSGDRGDEINAGTNGGITVSVPAMADGATVVLAVSNADTPMTSDLVFTIPTGHIYNGSEQGIGSVSSAPGITGLGLITVKYNNSAAVPKNAGTYIVTADIAAGDDYSAVNGLTLGTYEIGKKTLTVAADPIEKYFGQFDPTLTFTYSGNIASEIPGFSGGLMRDAGETVDSYDIFAGTLTLQNRAGDAGFDNFLYANYEFAFTPSVLTIKEYDPQAVATLSGATGNDGWFGLNDLVTLNAPAGFEITATYAPGSWSFWSSSITLDNSSEGEDKEAVYYLRSTTPDDTLNAVSTPKTITYNVDLAPPLGEIQIKTRIFNSFMNALTFGYFFKNTQSVAIDASDLRSGVESISYLVTETKYNEDGVKALLPTAWTAYNNSSKPSLEKGFMGYVYARIADKAGNLTFISSENVVIFEDSSGDSLEINATRISNEMSLTLNLNGNTIKNINDGTADLALGTDYTVSVAADVATVTFTKPYLNGLPVGENILTVSFNPQGRTETGDTGSDTPVSLEITINISRAEQTTPFVITNPGTKIYGDSSFTLAASGGNGTGGIAYAQLTNSLPLSEQAGTVYASGLVNITGAGTIHVRASKAADDDYNAAFADLIITVRPKSVTSYASDVTYGGKTYDGTTLVTGLSIASPTGILGGDDVMIDYDNAEFDNPNVGLQSVFVTGLKLLGNDAGKYILTNNSLEVYGTPINKANLTLTAHDKVVLVGEAEPNYTYSLSGLVGTDTDAGFAIPPSFTLDRPFTSTVADEFDIIPSGAVSANYNFNYVNGKLTVTDLIPVDITGLFAADKTYDGTASSLLTGTPGLSGVIPGDEVSLSGTAVGAFTDANAGNGKLVTVTGLYLSGADASKYYLVAPVLSADIIPAPLSVIGFDIFKYYDGTNIVTGLGAIGFSGLVGSEAASITAGSVTAFYDDENAGDNKPITFNHHFGMSGGTANPANYTISPPSGIFGSIARAAQTQPAAPTLALKTANEITLNVITGAEYRLSGGTWQDSPTFGGLNPNTDYTFFARLKENANLFASPESAESAAFTTDDGKYPQAAPGTFSLSYSVYVNNTSYTVTIPATAGAEYSFDGITFDDGNTISGILPGATVTGYKRMKETLTHNQSQATSASLTLPGFPAASPGSGQGGGSGSTPAASPAASASASASPSPIPAESAPTPGVSPTQPGRISGGNNVTTDAPAPTIPANRGAVAVEFSNLNGNVVLDLNMEIVAEIISSVNDNIAHFDLSNVSGTSTVTLPGDSVKALNEAELSVELSLPQGTMFLDSGAFSSVVRQANGENITLMIIRRELAELTASQRENLGSNDLVFNITLSGQSRGITDFDGEFILVTIPFDGVPPVTVWYLRDDGELEAMDCSYDEEKKEVSFMTSHLSYYVISSSELALNEPSDISGADSSTVLPDTSRSDSSDLVLSTAGGFKGWLWVGLGVAAVLVAGGVMVWRKRRDSGA
ncbi:MAG: alpha-amylase family glycosyl hydrolase [Lachnospiraceae bacterium]|nr:alpha-amylase family glycosyl hydrolase [Lachnospiraceae bacterium]